MGVMLPHPSAEAVLLACSIRRAGQLLQEEVVDVVSSVNVMK